MTATKVGIIYSVSQNVVRCIMSPDNDAQLVAFKKTIVPGEAYIEQPIADYQSRGAAVFLKEQVGPPLSDRCAVISLETNKVVTFLAGDPAIDGVLGHKFIPSDKAAIDDQFDGQKFLRCYAVVADTGVVTDVVMADIENPPHGIVIETATLKVGDIVPVPSVEEQPL